MKIDKINSPVYVGRLGEKGVLSIGFDVSDWLALFPLGTFSVDFKPDYLSESFSLPPALYGKVAMPDEIPDWSPGSWAKDVKVKHKGKIWLSMVDNNTWEPGAAGVYESIWKGAI